MTSMELTFSRPWGTLAAKAFGPADGAPWLALHGWLDNAATFDLLVPLLPPGLRIVSVDLPGHGLSSHRPAGTTYHYLDYVPECVAVLDALGWKQAGILGHSLGGTLAVVLAGTLPDRVTAAALIESVGPYSAPPKEGPARLATYITQLEKAFTRKPTVYRSREAAVAAREKTEIGTVSRRAAEVLAERGMEPVPGGFSWRSDLRLRVPSPSRFTEEQLVPFFENIRCPILGIRAEPGLLPKDAWERRAKTIPGFRTATVPGGHHVHLDEPAVVAAPIVDFLASLPR